MLLTKITAAQNEDALSYYRMRGLYFLAVVFVRSIDTVGLVFNVLSFYVSFSLLSVYIPSSLTVDSGIVACITEWGETCHLSELFTIYHRKV